MPPPPTEVPLVHPENEDVGAPEEAGGQQEQEPVLGEEEDQ